MAVLILSACGGGTDGVEEPPKPNSNADTSALIRWHNIAIDASGRDHSKNGAREQIGPVRAARAMAIVHTAIGDAIAAQSQRYAPFVPIAAAPTADPAAAVAQAAHDTLVSVFPAQKLIFDTVLIDDLNAIKASIAKDAGIALGRRAAQNIIDIRRNDGSELSEPYVEPIYQISQDVGKWRKDPLNPDQPILGSTWGNVRPFTLTSSTQFRASQPPALNSPEYTKAYNEAKQLGGDGVITPTSRTLDQSVSGIFWAYDGTPSLCAPTRLYNQIALQLGLAKGLDMPDLARLLAIANVAMMDAGISSWESKYFYSFWRPVTGIRESDAGTGPSGLGDENSATQGDINFTPRGAPASNLAGKDFTPPFPAYPSGHATFGGALFEVMRQFFGTDKIPFTFVSDEFNGITTDSHGNIRPLLPRSFNTLSEAEEENGQSRIYLGIHWSFDKTSGVTMGNQIGRYVFAHAYLPVKQ